MAVKALFELCVKAIFVATVNLQIVCTMLPPKLLQYLLYQAVILQNTSWIQGLVRYWPLETLNFDFDDFIDYTDIWDRSESYLRKYHSWYYSFRFPQMKLRSCVVDSIAVGLYLRAYHCHQSTSGNKQFIVNLTMVDMDWGYSRTNNSHPFVRLCHGMPPLPLEASDCVVDFDRVTVTSEKILLVVNTFVYSLSCLNTSPCAIQLKHACLMGDIKTVTTTVQPLENVTSLQCSADSLVEFVKFVLFLQKRFSDLNEVDIEGLYCVSFYNRGYDIINRVTDPGTNQRFQFITKHFPRLFNRSHTNFSQPKVPIRLPANTLRLYMSAEVNMPAVNTLPADMMVFHKPAEVKVPAVNMPGVACRRLHISTDMFSRLFNCAYHPFGKLQSLHITCSSFSQSKLEFNSEISKIIIHNCNSLLDLRMSGVTVLMNISLLQDALQKCHTLVVLSIRDGISNGLHEILYGIQGLLNLKYLDTTSTCMRGYDLCALHDLLYWGVPKLKDCCLTFSILDYTFKFPVKTEHEPIPEMLDNFMSSQKSKVMHDWLTGLRPNVNYKLFYTPSVSQ